MRKPLSLTAALLAGGLWTLSGAAASKDDYLRAVISGTAISLVRADCAATSSEKLCRRADALTKEAGSPEEESRSEVALEILATEAVDELIERGFEVFMQAP